MFYTGGRLIFVKIGQEGNRNGAHRYYCKIGGCPFGTALAENRNLIAGGYTQLEQKLFQPADLPV